VNLGQGFPDFDGPEVVKGAAIEAIRAGHGQYAPMAGVAALREAIAARYGERVDPERHVTVTAGCTEAIPSVLLGLVDPGDEVVLFEPYYDSYRACVAMAGATAKFVTLRAPDFCFDEAELRAAFSNKTKAVLVNTPHNPTGRVLTREELECIGRLCEEFDAIAVCDEVYEELVFEGEHVRMAELPGMWERTVTMSSLGKTFSLTGWKIGWVVAPEGLTAGVRAAHQFLTYAVNTPMQHAAAVALGMGEEYFDVLRAGYRAKRDMLCGALDAIGFGVRAPAGTYFVLADHSGFGFGDDVAFCKHLIEEVGVAAIPPTAFYEDKEAGRHLVRFAFCKREETLRAAVERLGKLQK
jgi:aspartate/methionine/tyrosine aminotransferase